MSGKLAVIRAKLAAVLERCSLKNELIVMIFDLIFKLIVMIFDLIHEVVVEFMSLFSGQMSKLI